MLFGLAGAWASTRMGRGLVYEVKPVDVLTLVGGCVLLAFVVLAASALPAVRAVRIPSARAQVRMKAQGAMGEARGEPGSTVPPHSRST